MKDQILKGTSGKHLNARKGRVVNTLRDAPLVDLISVIAFCEIQ